MGRRRDVASGGERGPRLEARVPGKLREAANRASEKCAVTLSVLVF